MINRENGRRYDADKAIRNYVKTNYPDARILQIEYDDNEYEIKLSNRWEITFDSKMRVIDIDD